MGRGTMGGRWLLDWGARGAVCLYGGPATSWNMPPGKAGDKDFTCSVRCSWRAQTNRAVKASLTHPVLHLKSDDEIRALVAKSNLKFSTIYGFKSTRQLQVGFTILAVVGLSPNPASWAESLEMMDAVYRRSLVSAGLQVPIRVVKVSFFEKHP